MSDALTRLAATLADRYTLERELGAGGTATARRLTHGLAARRCSRPRCAASIS